MGGGGAFVVAIIGGRVLAAPAHDFGAVLLEHELDLAGEDLEEGPVAGVVREDAREGFAEVGFQLGAGVVELLLGFDGFYHWVEF